MEAESFIFGSFQLFPGPRLLVDNGKAVPVGGRALDILTGHCHVNIGLAAWNQSDNVAPIMRRTGRSSPAAKY